MTRRWHGKPWWRALLPLQTSHPTPCSNDQTALTSVSSDGTATKLKVPSHQPPVPISTPLPALEAQLSNHKAAQESQIMHSASSVESRLFALIVAIDKYKSCEIPTLSGCENDGRSINDFLTKTLHVPSSHVIILVNEAASRHAIIANFKSHFIRNEEIQKGDAMIFFYAGHGSRVEAPPGWLADNNQIETICPHDERTKDDDENVIHGIPDRTIDGLMRSLAFHKGDNITAIFDSCHSGGISRVLGQKRFLPPASPSFPIPDNLDREIWIWGLSSRTAHAVVPTGFLYKSMSSHVLLAACRQDEAALEVLSSDNTPCGAFTSSLVKRLRDSNIGDLTYSRLIEILPSFPYQHPQCQGTNKDRVLFNTTVVKDRSKMFKVFKDQGEWTIEAGSIHGVVVGTEFAIPSHAEDIIATAVIVQAPRCIVDWKPKGVSPDIFDGASAVVSNWNNPKLKVRFHTPTGNLFSAVRAGERPDVAVHQNGQNVLLERLDPLIRRHAKCLLTTRQDRISEVLDAVAHFNFYLYHHPNCTPFNQKVTVQLHRLQKSNGDTVMPTYSPIGDDLLARDPEVVLSDDNAYRVKEVKEAVICDMDAFYGLTLMNHSTFDLFPYVFYLDPSDYSIQSWYCPPSATMLPPLPCQTTQGHPSRLAVGYGAFGTDAIQFSIPPGVASDSGFLKVFASTSYANMEFIEQSSPIHESSRHMNKMITPPFDMDQLWDAWTFVLTCYNAVP